VDPAKLKNGLHMKVLTNEMADGTRSLELELGIQVWLLILTKARTEGAGKIPPESGEQYGQMTEGIRSAFFRARDGPLLLYAGGCRDQCSGHRCCQPTQGVK